jgi:hypothetical protein
MYFKLNTSYIQAANNTHEGSPAPSEFLALLPKYASRVGEITPVDEITTEGRLLILLAHRALHFPAELLAPTQLGIYTIGENAYFKQSKSSMLSANGIKVNSYAPTAPLRPEVRAEVIQVDNRCISLVTAEDGQEVIAKPFDLNPEILDQTYLIEDWQRPDDEVERDYLKDYGYRLFAQLFGDGKELKGLLLYNQLYREHGAHINLFIHPKDTLLWYIPWEFMHDGNEFLALSGRYTINRFPWGSSRFKQVVPFAPPLRILLIVSDPQDLERLHTEFEVESVENALSEVSAKGLVELRHLEDASLEVLQRETQRERYHIIHFIGHGMKETAPDGIERNGLAFCDPRGNSRMVTLVFRIRLGAKSELQGPNWALETPTSCPSMMLW